MSTGREAYTAFLLKAAEGAALFEDRHLDDETDAERHGEVLAKDTRQLVKAVGEVQPGFLE